MKTVQATKKPPYNVWIAYIHKNVKNTIIEWPTESSFINSQKQKLNELRSDK